MEMNVIWHHLIYNIYIEVVDKFLNTKESPIEIGFVKSAEGA